MLQRRDRQLQLVKLNKHQVVRSVADMKRVKLPIARKRMMFDSQYRDQHFPKKIFAFLCFSNCSAQIKK